MSGTELLSRRKAHPFVTGASVATFYPCTSARVSQIEQSTTVSEGVAAAYLRALDAAVAWERKVRDVHRAVNCEKRVFLREALRR